MSRRAYTVWWPSATVSTREECQEKECWTASYMRDEGYAQSHIDAVEALAIGDSYRFSHTYSDGSYEMVVCYDGEVYEDDDDDDDSWRREMAMEAGMLHGIDAYNEVMGHTVSEYRCFNCEDTGCHRCD